MERRRIGRVRAFVIPKSSLVQVRVQAPMQTQGPAGGGAWQDILRFAESMGDAELLSEVRQRAL